MFAVQAVVSVPTLLGTTQLARRAARQLRWAAPVLPDDVRRAVRRYAWLTTVQVALATVVSQRSEFLFLDRYSTASEIALFSIPYGLMGAAARVPESLGGVFMPAVATLFGAGQTNRIRTGYLRALRMLTLLTLPMTAALVATGGTLIHLLYGHDYDGASKVLVVMAISFPIIPLVSVTTGVLEGLGRKAAVITTLAVGTVVDLGVAFLAIPAHGAVGAAVANAAAQVAGAAVALAFVSRSVSPFEWRWPPIVAAFAVAGIGGVATRVAIVVVGETWLGLLAASSVGGVVMVGLTIALRGMWQDEVSWLLDTMSGRPKLARPLARLLSTADRAVC
jgi:O-antigen/teichoic acid export membrane protein